MSRPLFDLSVCNIFCTKKAEHTYQVDVWTKDNEFIASTELQQTKGDLFAPDGIVARFGYGRSFHRLLVDIATDLGGALAIVRDGDARGGAMTVWSDFYRDKMLTKHNIEHLPDDIDWTSPDDDPQLFHAYKSKDVRLVSKQNIHYSNAFDPLTESLAKKGASIFHDAYDKDDNRWIDDEFPLRVTLPTSQVCIDI